MFQEKNTGADRSTTLGGDQLTRCHLDSAKDLRAGAHEKLERFENLTPILEEMFHVQQDLLEVETCTDMLTNVIDSGVSKHTNIYILNIELQCMMNKI